MRFRLTEDNEITDSNGNILSPQQIEYFKNSKIRDNQGRLLEVYRGHSNKNITVFDCKLTDEFFSASHQIADEYDNDKDTGEPGRIYECYLNITNPFDLSTEEQMKVIKDQYIPWLEKKGRELPTDDVMVIGKKVSFAGLADDLYIFLKYMNRKNLLSYDGMIVNERLPNSILARFDSKYDPNTSYVPFFENQIKFVSNKNPTLSNNCDK